MAQEIAELGVKIDPTGSVQGAAVVDKSMARVRNAAKQTRDEMGRFDKATTGVGFSLRSLTGPLGAIFGGLTIAATVRDAVRTFGEFTQELATLKAVSSATAEQLSVLEDVARETGLTTQFSASQAASGLVELAKAGLTTEQQIASLPATLQLAAIAGSDLADSSAIVVRSLAQFQLAADQSGRVADVLAAAANASTTDVRDLALALSFVGSTANSVGLDIEQTSGFLAVLANNALNGARGGTALRGVISTLVRPTKEAANELKQLGIDQSEIDVTTVGLAGALERLKNAQIDTRQATILFGRETAAGALALINNVDAARKFEDQLRKSGGTAQQFADTVTDTLQGSFRKFRGAVEEVYISLGDEGGLGSALKGTVEFATELVKAMSGATSAIGGLNEVVDVVFATFQEVIGTSVDGWENLIDVIVNDVPGAFNDLVDFIGQELIKVQEFFNSIGQSVLQVLNDLGVNTRDVIGDVLGFFKDVGNGIYAVFKTAGDIAGRVLTAIYNQINSSIDALELLLRGEVAAAKSVAENSAQLFRTAMSGAFTDVSGQFKKNFEEDVVGKALDTGEDFAHRFIEGAKAVFAGDGASIIDRIRANAATRAAERVRRENERQARRNSQAGPGVPTGGGDAPSDLPVSQDIEEAFGKTRSRLEQELRLVGLTNDARERAVALTQFQAEAEKTFGHALDENDPRLIQFTERLDQLQNLQDLRTAFDDFGDSAKSAFKEFATGSKSAEDAFRSFLSSFGDRALDRLINTGFDALLFGGLGGGAGGGGGGLFSLLAGTAGRGFADGGRPPVGRASVVGETGPELFVPDQAGTVISNRNASSAMGSPNVNIVNVLDQDQLLGALNTSRGEQAVMNIIRRNKSAIRRDVA